MGSGVLALLLLSVFICGIVSTKEGETVSREKRWTSVTVKCKDIGRKCLFLARNRYCRLAPAYMSKICMKSCNLCGKKRTYDGWSIHMSYQGDRPK